MVTCGEPFMDYDYDLFISYSSLDKEWAAKLADALGRKSLKVFIDRQRLEAGRPWEPQLKQALASSQHLVVLWSNNAKQSDWVQKEIAHFDAVALVNRDVYQRAMMLEDCLRSDTSVFLVLPPFPIEPTIRAYRDLVQGWSAPLFDAYFDPPVPKRERLSPNCGVYCGDETEIKRLLRSAVGQFVSGIQPSSKPVFTRVQGGNG